MNSVALSYRFDSVPAGPRDHIRHTSLPPSVPGHLKGATVEKSYGKNGKTFREQLTTPVVKDRVSATISHLPAKVIAQATGSSLKTAENARQGNNAMSLAHFLNACREIPELRAEAMRLMGCEMTCDPEFERGVSMLVNSWTRRNGGKP